MLFVQVQHLAGEQQTHLIQDITEAFVRVAGEGIRSNVLVTVSEIASGLWATAGIFLTLEEVERRRLPHRAKEK
jgi:phenylpyruvate tautomerase PptA (4-oxalocrotonate tautomerase family)